MAKRERKRMTAGEKIAYAIDPEGTITAALWRRKIARRIDAAIRKAAWEGFIIGERGGGDDIIALEKTYGPRPARRK